MSAFTALLGDTLDTRDSKGASTAKVLAGKEVVGLYFSAHWCPPCRGFTPKLADIYKDLQSAGKAFEIVFVSSDRDEDSFNEYYGEQPWTALPFAARDCKAALSKKYKVKGIPSLVLLDAKGEVITTEGREAVMEPENFPWVPPTLGETLGKVEIVTKTGTTSLKQLQAAGTEHLLLYFSAHWCPPCRGFTPKLAATYAKLKERLGAKVECVFVSSDRDQASFDEYFGEQPWTALSYDDRASKEALSSYFEVQGIPSLVLLDAQTLETVNADARGQASGDPDGQNFPWAPLLVKDLDEDPGDLNDTPTVVVLAEKAEGEWDAIEAVLAEVATEAKEAAAKGGEAVGFGVAKEMGGVGAQIRKLTKLGQPGKAAQCVLLDLGDDGGFYAGPAEITAASIRELLAGYRAGSLTRCQCGS